MRILLITIFSFFLLSSCKQDITKELKEAEKKAAAEKQEKAAAEKKEAEKKPEEDAVKREDEKQEPSKLVEAPEQQKEGGIDKEKLTRAYEEIYCAQKRQEMDKLLDIYKKYGFESPKDFSRTWIEAAKDTDWLTKLAQEVPKKCQTGETGAK
ncbi:MAG: hypothetical protein FJ088_01165 [Deltaproteobacteria bacterium]|nr:hypothetical protein [Deltaproteobacteria bacterium]